MPKTELTNFNDEVNHPSHYTFGKFEVIEVLSDWFHNDPLLWNATKYLVRAGKKDKSKEIQDLEKAVFYINYKIATLKGGKE